MELSTLAPVFRLPVDHKHAFVDILSLTSKEPSRTSDEQSLNSNTHLADEDLTPPSPMLPQIESQRFSEPHSLEGYLQRKDREGYTVQLISVTKENSYAPLDISTELLQTLLRHHVVMPAFQQVTLAFRPMSNRLEEAYSEPLWKREHSGILELTYVLKFPEQRVTGNAHPEWSIRKLGIYQKFDIKSKQNTWILIFPNRASTIQHDLAHELGLEAQDRLVCNHPLGIHVFLFLARIDNWRMFVSQFENEVWEQGNLAATIDFGEILPFREIHTDLSTLYYLESRLSPLRSILATQMRLLDDLGLINDRLLRKHIITGRKALEMTDVLRNLKSRISANSENVDFVLSKLSRVIELLSSTIELKSQHTSENMAGSTYILTKSAFEDSTSMRVTTFTTLLFLPSTFVAGLFGMGFFDVSDTPGSQWIVSPLVWIFFAIAIPLTAVTLCYWRWSMARAIRQRSSFVGRSVV